MTSALRGFRSWRLCNARFGSVQLWRTRTVEKAWLSLYFRFWKWACVVNIPFTTKGVR
jgi:hypothetical protein